MRFDPSTRLSLIFACVLPLLAPTALADYSTCGTGGDFGWNAAWTTYSFDYVNKNGDRKIGQYLAIGASKTPEDGPHALVVSMHGYSKAFPDAFSLANNQRSIIADAVVKYFFKNLTRAEGIYVVPVQPYTPEEGGWQAFPEESLHFLEQVLIDAGKRYDYDLNRVYIEGSSMGAIFLAANIFDYQDTFAGLALNCGAPNPSRWGINYSTENVCRLPTRMSVASQGPDSINYLPHLTTLQQTHLEPNGNLVEFDALDCATHCCGGNEPKILKPLEFWETQATNICAEVAERPERSGCGKFRLTNSEVFTAPPPPVIIK